MGYTIKDDPRPNVYETLADAKTMAGELAMSQGQTFEIYQEGQRFPCASAATTRRERDALRHMFRMEPAIIDPIPPLVSLRQTVLSISHARLPKWRFRLAPDLVVQMQPKPAERRDKYALCVGLVIEGAEIAKAHFATWQARAGLPLTALGFSIREVDEHYYASSWQPGQWVLSWTRWNVRSIDTMRALKDRLVDALQKIHELKTSMMFQPFCLLCGKALTDPVSMARWIGPECAHHCGVANTLDVRQFNLS